MVRRSRLSRTAPIYQRLRFGRLTKFKGIPTRSISGEYAEPVFGSGFMKFSATEYLMKIRHGMSISPAAFNKIWGMVKNKYGLTEYDWSFIRDEHDPVLLKEYLRIADEATGGKYPWLKGGK